MNDDQLRLSDAERDRAAAELGEHYAQGRLTAEEHAERLDRIWAARTRGELAPLFRDLPGRYGAPAPAPAPSSWRGGAGRPTYWRGLPGPVLAVLAVLVTLTVLTHLPFVLVGVLLALWFSARRRSRPRPPHWARSPHWR